MYSFLVDYSGWAGMLGFPLAGLGFVINAFKRGGGVALAALGIAMELSSMLLLVLFGGMRHGFGVSEIVILVIAAVGIFGAISNMDTFEANLAEKPVIGALVGVFLIATGLVFTPSTYTTLSARTDLRTLAMTGIKSISAGRTTVTDPDTLQAVGVALTTAASSAQVPWDCTQPGSIQIRFENGQTRSYLVASDKAGTTGVIAATDWGPGLHQALLEDPVLFKLVQLTRRH